mmetsp:Transcript_102821/g.273420  ORF Transcript_102821/g.273420 Transcript_102821/m.273420 type:complete len:205 (+) Transcript_102821:790-1404(+)
MPSLTCTKDSSVCWSMALSPVLGSSMEFTSAVTSASSFWIWPVLTWRLSLLAVRSALHQSNCSLSTLPSSAMTFFISVIAARTFSKGLPVSKSTAARASLLDFRDRAACVRRCATSRRLAASAELAPSPAARCSWRLTLASCTKKLVAPVEVAATLPKASKAASLSRIAMASVMAASSFTRSRLRSSYSFVFSEHIVPSLAKKS